MKKMLLGFVARNWNNKPLRKDMDNPQNRDEAVRLMPLVIQYLTLHGGCDLQQLYVGLDCNDLPLYLAVDALVHNGVIKSNGMVYLHEFESHHDYHYSL